MEVYYLYFSKTTLDEPLDFLSIYLAGFMRVHTSMNAHSKPRDLGRAKGRSYVNVSQLHRLFTDVCVTSVAYHHDVKSET